MLDKVLFSLKYSLFFFYFFRINVFVVIHYKLEALLMSTNISMFSWRNRQKKQQLFLRFLHVFFFFFCVLFMSLFFFFFFFCFFHVSFNFIICFCLIQIPQYNLRHRRSKSNGDDLVLDHRPSGLLNLGKDISPAIPPHIFHVFCFLNL